MIISLRPLKNENGCILCSGFESIGKHKNDDSVHQNEECERKFLAPMSDIIKTKERKELWKSVLMYMLVKA